MAEKRMQVGSFHHQMTTVKNMDEAVRLYRDVLGLELMSRVIVPNDIVRPAEGKGGTKEVFGVDIDRVWEIVTLDNGKGAPVELCHPLYPEVVLCDKSTDYGYTGHTEQGFAVKDIDAWYDWIVQNGYRPQSKPWQAGPGCMTFAFYDTEGNVIQLYEDPDQPAIPRWNSIPGMPVGMDFRTPEQKAWAEETYKK